MEPLLVDIVIVARCDWTAHADPKAKVVRCERAPRGCCVE
jgi:hypothetical protein